MMLPDTAQLAGGQSTASSLIFLRLTSSVIAWPFNRDIVLAAAEPAC